MAAPSYVFTIAKVAKMLDEEEALLEEIALDMEPEGGRLYIYDLDDDVQVTAFTLRGRMPEGAPGRGQSPKGGALTRVAPPRC